MSTSEMERAIALRDELSRRLTPLQPWSCYVPGCPWPVVTDIGGGPGGRPWCADHLALVGDKTRSRT